MMNVSGVNSILDLGTKIIDRVWTDPGQRATAKLELYKAHQAGEFYEADQLFRQLLVQAKAQEMESMGSSIFIAGWRPFIGWVCGVAFSLKFIIGPAFIVIMNQFGVHVTLPVLDVTEITALLAGMLGIGGLRTIEKIKGVQVDSYDKIKSK